MRVQNVLSWMAIVGTVLAWPLHAASGQESKASSRTLRFLYASSSAASLVEIDMSSNAMLRRMVSLSVEHGAITDVLTDIQRQTGLTFGYDAALPAHRIITLIADSISVGAALGAVLAGTGVDVVLTSSGHIWLTEVRELTLAATNGSISGRITEKRTGAPLVGATVILDPSGQTASSGNDGLYRFANVSPGEYLVRARYIGFIPVVGVVQVGANEEAAVDLAMEKSAHQLEEVVTTGTVVPTEVKALPTPISVITASEIDLQRPRAVNQLFRQAVPSGVSWVESNFPNSTAMSARGASSLSPGGSAMKVFVDGVELSGRAVSPVDPTSIDRIEVIRGPQAATIYGSDAIGGVIQIFTKRGDPTAPRPQVSASAGLGVLQTPYEGYGGTVRQQYTGAIRGAGTGFSYNIGGGYTHLGDWMPEGAQSLPSVYAGIRAEQGPVSLDISGRHYEQVLNQSANPELAKTGFVPVSKPFYQRFRIKEQTVGARLAWTPVPWLHHSLLAGVDRYLISANQSQPRLTTPTDTLLLVDDQNDSKTSVAYNVSASGTLSRDVDGTLSLGLDHYDFRTSLYLTIGALDTLGAIRTAPGSPVSGNRAHVTNTGYFAQAQLNYRSAFFVTAGLRAEKNSTFGTDLGTPVSPRVGASYARTVGTTSMKVRASYGEAIRPPTPGASLPATTGVISQIGNPNLRPERQKGWDGGVDLVFGSRGSIGVTYYQQIAEDLIQTVLISSTAPIVQQNQNVARVKNRGLELDASLSVGPANLRAQGAINSSRIEALTPTYAGDLRVGERPFQVPKYTAGGSVALIPLEGTAISAGLTYVGSFRQYDYLAQYACLGGTRPCQPSTRGYLISYPGFAKIDLSVTQRLTRWASGFLSMENVGNNAATENSNITPVTGRLTTIGVDLRY